MKICNFNDCSNKHDSHGFCANHARQYRKYGHPLSKEEVSQRLSEAASKRKPTLGKTWNIDPAKREAMKGIRKNTGKTHFKRELMLGSLNRNWKGGVTKAHILIRNSAAYREWRKQVFQRDSFTCVECGDSTSGKLNADHIKPFALFPELRLELTNGRTLCVDCHKKTDSYLNNKIQKENYYGC